MRRSDAVFLPTLLGLVALAAGCPAGGAAPERKGDVPAAIDTRIATLRDALLDTGREAILYRALEHEGQVWDYPDGYDKTERPMKSIPHHALDAAARGRLASLLGPDRVQVVEKSDFPRYSYLLELIAKDGTISRVDFHTEGGDVPVLFWMPEPGLHAKTEPVHIGFVKGGREAWRDALDAVWSGGR